MSRMQVSGVDYGPVVPSGVFVRSTAGHGIIPGVIAPLERRVSLVVILGGIVAWTALLLWMPARFPGFDEAKYLGIGLNMLDGQGPITVFGQFFEPHSPLWAMLMAFPQAWFGLDAYGWAHLLVIASSSLVLGLGAVFGWRVRPAVGALTVAAILAFPYVFELSRHLGLDMSVAALTLAYLLIGGIAVGRGSVRWGIATGLTFGFAFLVKESILPVAPVPFLAAIAAGRPGAGTARIAAWTLLTTAVLTSWWWWMYAAETGRAYRFNTPAWTLVPLLVAVLVAAAIGLAWPRAMRTVGRLPGAGWRSRAMATMGAPRLGWGLALIWTVVLGAFLSRTSELRGYGLVDPGQIAFYAGTWLGDLRPVVAVGGIGAVIELGSRIVGHRRPGPVVDDLWLALLCSLPLILLVIGVGDVPRHYVAQMVLLLVIGSTGWLALVEAAVRRPTPARIVALAVSVIAAGVLLAPLARGRVTAVVAVAAVAVVILAVAILVGRRRLDRAATARWFRTGGAAVLVVIVAGLGATGWLLASTVAGRAPSSLDAAKAAAVAAIVGWVDTELPAGSTVAFGSSLSMETAVQLHGDHPAASIRESVDVVVDPHAPLGVTRSKQPPTDDWIALAASPRSAQTMVGYQAGPLLNELRRTKAAAWVHVEEAGVGDALVVDGALTPEQGFERAASWSWPTDSGALDVTIYRVDHAALGFDRTVWASEPALQRLVTQLEANGGRDARAAAAALLERLKVHPDDPGAPALLERLRALAGG